MKRNVCATTIMSHTHTHPHVHTIDAHHDSHHHHHDITTNMCDDSEYMLSSWPPGTLLNRYTWFKVPADDATGVFTGECGSNDPADGRRTRVCSDIVRRIQARKVRVTPEMPCERCGSTNGAGIGTCDDKGCGWNSHIDLEILRFDQPDHWEGARCFAGTVRVSVYFHDAQSRIDANPWLKTVGRETTKFEDLADTQGEDTMDDAILSSVWDLFAKTPNDAYLLRLLQQIVDRQSLIWESDPSQPITGRQCVYLALRLHDEDDEPPSPTDDGSQAQEDTEPQSPTDDGSQAQEDIEPPSPTDDRPQAQEDTEPPSPTIDGSQAQDAQPPLPTKVYLGRASDPKQPFFDWTPQCSPRGAHLIENAVMPMLLASPRAHGR